MDLSTAKSKVLELSSQLEKASKQLRNAKDRETRVRKRCSDLLDELRMNNLLTEELTDKLAAFKGMTQIHLMILMPHFLYSFTLRMFSSVNNVKQRSCS